MVVPIDPVVTEERRVTITVEAPKLSVRCGYVVAHIPCPVKFKTKVCGSEKVLNIVSTTRWLILESNVPLGRINIRIINKSSFNIYVNLQYGDIPCGLGNCPRNAYAPVSPGGSVTGYVDAGDKKYISLYFTVMVEASRDIDGKSVTVGIEAWSDVFEKTTTECSTETFRFPHVGFTDLKVDSKFYEKVPGNFSVKAKLSKCPVKDLILGIKKVSGPGSVYWLKKDGKWHEVGSDYTYDVIKSGVVKPDTEGSYGGKLRFDKRGTYTLVFGVGFHDFPTSSEVYAAGIPLKGIEELMKLGLLSEPTTSEVVTKPPVMYVVKKEVEVEEEGVEIPIPKIVA